MFAEPGSSRSGNYIVDHLIDFDSGSVPTLAPVANQVGRSSFVSSARDDFEEDVPALEPNAELDDWYFRVLATPKGKANAIPSNEAHVRNFVNPKINIGNTNTEHWSH